MKKKYLLTFVLLTFSFLSFSSPFITRWDLSLPSLIPDSIKFFVGTTGIVNYTWETIPAGTSGSGTFTGTTAIISGFPSNSVIRLSIDSANFNRIHFDFFQNEKRLIDIEQWGTIRWSNMFNAFRECENLNISATDIPDLSNVTIMTNMFAYCSSLNGPANINSWDVSHVKSTCSMFMYASKFNQPIDTWDVSNDTTMAAMFGADSSFNQPLGNWNTSKVIDMSWMFSQDTVFNQLIGNWNTSKVKLINGMFEGSKLFNQPLINWITDSITCMNEMFKNAISFNQSLGNWHLKNNVNMLNMLDSSGMDCINYSSTINAWASNPNIPSGIFLGAANIHYSPNAVANRDFLINTKGWAITGDILDSTTCFPLAVTTNENKNTMSNFYPNPANYVSSFDITIDKNETANLIVYNTIGQIVYKDKLNLLQGKNTFQLNTENYSNGIYSVIIKINELQILKHLQLIIKD